MILTMLASDGSTVTPLARRRIKVRTDAPVTIRLLIPTPAQRVSCARDHPGLAITGVGSNWPGVLGP